MDLLLKTGAVKLRSHLDKLLVGDEDKETVRQSRNGSSNRAIWVVEPCPKNPDVIRLKNLSTGLYLTASDTVFLMGMTGNRVVQLSIFDPARVEWEPINDGIQVKFRSRKEGTYLRGNGGMPPWRNSVTHDMPLNRATYTWILWDVEPVLLSDLKLLPGVPSPMSSFNSVLSDGIINELNPSSPNSVRSISSSLFSPKSISSPGLSRKRSGMDLFCNAKAVRLKSHHDKYLIAEEDEDSVTQDRNGASRNAKWSVEFIENGIRLKSCYNKYLTASNQHFLLGMTGCKVLQTLPTRLDSSVEWEPVKVGSQVRLRTRYGNFLRANGGLPPWRNSITHDVPHRTVTQDWVLWDIDIVEILEHSDQIYTPKQEKVDPVRVAHSESFGSDSSSVSAGSDRFQRQESIESTTYSPPKAKVDGFVQSIESTTYSPPKAKVDGRLIYYEVADDVGIIDDGEEGKSLIFKGHSVGELTRKLEEETGVEDMFVCTRSPLNGKLYPLRLQLPPNNADMHIVVVPSTSRLAREFGNGGIL